MTKKILTLVIVCALPLFAVAQNIKLGYINSQEVLMMMPEISDVEKQMADFNAQNTQYLQEMQKEIQDKMTKYEAEQPTLSEAIRKVKEEELYSLQERLQTTYQTFQQEAQAKQQKLIQPLQEKLKNAIETVSKRQGLMFCYDIASGAIVYKSDAATDITSAVKKELGIF